MNEPKETDIEGARNLLLLAKSPARRTVEILLQADGRYALVKCWLHYPKGAMPFMMANSLLVTIKTRPGLTASVAVRSKRPASKVSVDTFRVKDVDWKLAPDAKKSFAGLVDDLADLSAEIVVKDMQPVLVLRNPSRADRSKSYKVYFRMLASLK